MFMTRASFRIAIESDTHLVLIDLDDGRSLANDIVSVIARLDQSVKGGIRNRRIYYRDTSGRFHQITVQKKRFSTIISCTDSQQKRLAEMLEKLGKNREI